MTRRAYPLALLVGLAVALSVPPARAMSEDDLIEQPGSPTDRYLTPEEVRARLHEANDAFFSCFASRLMGPEPGECSVYFTIAHDGRPVDVRAEVQGETPGLAECLEQVVSGLSFPEHDGDPLEVAYPVVFLRDEKGARVVPYPVVFTRGRTVDFVLMPIPPALTDEQRALLLRLLWPSG